MGFETTILHEFAHKGLKILDTLNNFLEMYDLVPTGGLKDPSTRKTVSESVGSLAQAVEDLRTLAICEEVSNRDSQDFDWKTLIGGRLARSGHIARTIDLRVDEVDFVGRGYPALIEAVVGNFVWFTRMFSSGAPIEVRLASELRNRRSWILLRWNFGTAFSVAPEFGKFEPFYYMAPKEALTLPKSTGLVFCAIKRVAEVHGGSLTLPPGQSVVVEFACPQSIDGGD